MVTKIFHYIRNLVILFFTVYGYSQSATLEPYLLPGVSFFVFCFGKADASSIALEFEKLANSPDLLRLTLKVNTLPSNGKLYDLVMSNIELHHESSWVLIDRSGTCLLQGSSLPTAESLLEATLRSNYKSPTDTLNNFLRSYPMHLDAKEHLIRELRILIERRLTPSNNGIKANMFSRLGNLMPENDMTKILEDEEDVDIFNAYAKEVLRCIDSGDWRKIGFHNPISQTPIETFSSVTKRIYRSKLPIIRSAVEELPHSLPIWWDYTWIVSILDDDDFLGFVNSLHPFPASCCPTSRMDSHMFEFIIFQMQRRSQWEALAEFTLQHWKHFRLQQHSMARSPRFNNSKFLAGRLGKMLFETQCKEYFEPMIESLLRVKNLEDADIIVSSLTHMPHLRGINKIAADIALRLEFPQLATKWRNLQIQEYSNDLVSDDLNALLFLENDSPLILLFTDNAREISFKSLLESDMLVDWRINPLYLEPDLVSLLKEQFALEATDILWVLLDHNRNVIGHGEFLPTEELLIQLLKSSNLATIIENLRHFCKDNPNNINAKYYLAVALKTIAETHTVRKSRGDVLSDQGLLREQDDHQIWYDFANYFSRLLPVLIDNSKSFLFDDSFYTSSSFKFSPILIALAPRILSLIEEPITRQPTNSFLWSIWASFAYLIPNYSINDFISSIVFSPFDNPVDLPPEPIRNTLISELLSAERWHEVVSIHGYRWEKIMPLFDQYDLQDWPLGFTSVDAANLVHAYLKINDFKKAEDIVLQICKSSLSTNFKSSLKDIPEIADDSKCSRWFAESTKTASLSVN